MSIIITKEEFLRRAKEKHGDKYVYDKMEYRVMSEKVLITCPLHGDFLQLAESHCYGMGCQKCSGILRGDSNRKSQENFIWQLKQVFGDLYTYDNLKYKGDKNKVSITCPVHGDFLILPTNCLRGWGCKKCSKENKLKEYENIFFNKCKEIHKNKYDYSKAIYKGNNHKIRIICPLHGAFEQIPRSHSIGYGCYECAKLIFGKSVKSNTIDFIKKSKLIHGDTYNYDEVNYKNADTKVTIKCFIHGNFEQIPRSHLSECGCPECNKYQGYSRSHWVNHNKNKEGTFYIIRCWNEEEEFYKIGITGNSVKERYPCGGDLKYNWKIVKEMKSKNLKYIWDLEKKIKNELKNFKYKPKIKFAGSSVECFSLIKLNYICNLK